MPVHLVLSRFLCCLLGLILVHSGRCQENPDKRIEDLIRQLGSEEYDRRESAGTELVKIGSPAVPRLRSMVRETKDPEIETRAREIFIRIQEEEYSRAQATLKKLGRSLDQLDETLIGHLQPHLLDLNRSKVTNQDLLALQGLKEVTAISLANTRIGNEGLRNLVGMENLKSIRLDDTNVTDEGLIHFAQMQKLRSLKLMNTKITDQGLGHLKRCSALEYLDLTGTGVSIEGITSLKKSLPGLRITGVVLR